MPEEITRVVVAESSVRFGDEPFVLPRKPSNEEILITEMKLMAKTAVVATAVHPFNFAQTLMQLGYEPLPARLGTDLFGKPVYYLASVFDYLQHIRKQTGFSGLFLGLKPTILAAIGGVYAYRGADRLVQYIYDEKYLGRPTGLKVKRFGFLEPRVGGEKNVGLAALRAEPAEIVGVSYTSSTFLEDLTKEVVIISLSTAAVWPVQVISLRTMAQFIGGENIYNGIMNSIREILDTEGIAGFFKGLFPVWYSYVSITFITYAGVYAYANYNPVNPFNLRLIAAAAGAVANSFFYPLKLTGRLMAVSGARLAAARPPRMPTFNQWRDMHRYLVDIGESKRGSSMLFRKVPVKVPVVKAAGLRQGTVYRMDSRGADNWAGKQLTSLVMGSTYSNRFAF